ncbi:MAG: hypothetical protein OZ917_12100 [Candidatus Brocadiaceae bacterium]|nr:hypothetical protein [Candidatus Brocadiaceae bacterium]
MTKEKWIVPNPKMTVGKWVITEMRITIGLMVEKFAVEVLRVDVVCPIRMIVSRDFWSLKVWVTKLFEKTDTFVARVYWYSHASGGKVRRSPSCLDA